MANYYYSGQGSLYVAKRNATTGAAEGFVAVGNVPELTIDIETTNFEHKESESGSRLVDLVIVKEKKGKFNFKLENLNIDNLAMALWGTVTNVAGGTITNEVIKVPTGGKGKRYPLAHPKVSAITVTGTGGSPSYSAGTDYTVDAANGVITVLTSGTITENANIEVDYTYAAGSKLDAFTDVVAPERWLRFEGINTIDSSRVIIDIYRAQFDPMTGYGLINEELGSVDMKGTILADTLRVSGSQFFTQTNVA